jgi:hypothetical protein
MQHLVIGGQSRDNDGYAHYSCFLPAHRVFLGRPRWLIRFHLNSISMDEPWFSDDKSAGIISIDDEILRRSSSHFADGLIKRSASTTTYDDGIALAGPFSKTK